MKLRKSIRLNNYDYSQPGYYFVTICAKDRKECFGEIINGEMVLNPCGEIVRDTWQWLGQQYGYVFLDQFVIMPDHIHGIIRIRRGRSRTARTSRTAPTQVMVNNEKIKPLGRLIGAFKTVSTKKINQIQNTNRVQIWQRSFHDHIIRNKQSLREIRKYITENTR